MLERKSSRIWVGAVVFVLFCSWEIRGDEVDYGIGNNAAIVSHTLPENPELGSIVNATITVRNTGGTGWSAAQGYSLAITQDTCGLGPALPRLVLPPDYVMPPGGTFVFTLPLVILAEGSCTFEFRMVQEGVEFFGETLSVTMQIEGTQIDPIGTVTSPNPVMNGNFQGPIVLDDKLVFSEGVSNRLHFFEKLSISPGIGNYLFFLTLPQSFLSFDSIIDGPQNTIFISNSNFDVGSGVVYQFNGTNGSLLRTFSNPNGAPNDAFGTRIATASGRLLVGAPGVDAGGENEGAAYLFDADPSSPTYGDLLLTLNNPELHEGSNFGESLAMTADRLLIRSTPYYLFDGDPMSGDFGEIIVKLAGFDALQSGSANQNRNGQTLRAENSIRVEGNRFVITFFTGTEMLELKFDAATGAFLSQTVYPFSVQFDDLIVENEYLIRVDTTARRARLIEGATGKLINIYQLPFPPFDIIRQRASIVGNTVFIRAPDDDIGAVEDAGVVYLFPFTSPQNSAPGWERYN